ncbi:hypothetical protein [Nocardia veterana]|uniref:Tetratricopeptide repeat protein n=1 Tax=Nocardia veterana TaxID=132249 RepID=A0A7X6LU63_9NOCA|nr:hypothetical protein [Nocardia veterana]NKY84570.1 hypothetical protein [Nocardia veterana]
MSAESDPFRDEGDMRELTEAAIARLRADPAAAERMLRQAVDIGSGVLSDRQLARLASLVVTAVAQQRGREDDLAAAALAAAHRWMDVSAADAAHHTVLAARVHYRRGRYRSALPLLASALSAAELPYPPEEIAVLYEQLGHCLQQGRRYRAAARAYRSGAAVVVGRSQWAELHGDLVGAAARAELRARGPVAWVREGAAARWQRWTHRARRR